jgi:hypothetical protein
MGARKYFWLTVCISTLIFVVYLSIISLPGFKGFLANCSAKGYGADWYLASCSTPEFGDYEHGAFYYQLEPKAIEHLKNAEIIFFGNSRMQHALSNQALVDFFKQLLPQAKYYLFGFGYAEPYQFSLDLYKKFDLRPKVAVIAIDGRIFETHVSDVYRRIKSDPKQRINYAGKGVQQKLHHWYCKSEEEKCGQSKSVFRSFQTGIWNVEYLMPPQNVEFTITDQVDMTEVDKMSAVAQKFIAELNVAKECVIFISVPFPWWNPRQTVELAKRLGVQSVEHDLGDRWITIDKSHLTVSEGQRYTAHILKKMEPTLKRCL